MPATLFLPYFYFPCMWTNDLSWNAVKQDIAYTCMLLELPSIPRFLPAGMFFFPSTWHLERCAHDACPKKFRNRQLQHKVSSSYAVVHWHYHQHEIIIRNSKSISLTCIGAWLLRLRVSLASLNVMRTMLPVIETGNGSCIVFTVWFICRRPMTCTLCMLRNVSVIVCCRQ